MKTEGLEVKFEPFELPEDYKFLYKIKGSEHNIDFDTSTITDKILSTRTKIVDEEVIRLLKSIGEERGINELILVDESKVLNLIKAVRALEVIKEKRVNCYLFINSENLKDYNACVDDTTEKRLTQEEYDLLKEVML